MFRRAVLAVVLVSFPHAVTSSAPVPEGGGAGPAIIARLQPFEKLFDDAKFLAGKFGKPEAAKDLEEKLLEWLGIENLAASGIDIKKPIGAYVYIAAEWTDSTIVGMLPVADEKAMLAWVGKFQVKADKIEDGFYSLALPNEPLPVFVRFSGGYAYVAFTAATQKEVLKESLTVDKLLPAAKVFAGNEAAALAISLRPEQIPESVRKTVLEYVADQIKEAADDEDGDFTKAQIRVAQKWIELFARDGREASLKLNFDRTSGELGCDFALTPKAETMLATEIAAIQPAKSLFTKLVGPQGAINYAVNMALEEFAKTTAKQFRDAGDDIFDLFNISIEDEKQKEEMRKVFRAVAPSFETGSFDGAVTLRGPGAKHYTGLGGVRLKDGKKIEEQLRKAVAMLPEEPRDRVKFDAEKAGEYAIHSIKIDEDSDSTKKMFGEGPIYFAFRDDAIVFGIGEGASKVVGEAIASLTPQPAPAFQIDVTGGKLKAFCDALDEDAYPHVQRILGTDDRLRILAANCEGGTALKANVSVSLQAIVGMVLMTMEGFGG